MKTNFFEFDLGMTSAKLKVLSSLGFGQFVVAVTAFEFSEINECVKNISLKSEKIEGSNKLVEILK